MNQRIISNINTLRLILNNDWINRLETDYNGIVLRLRSDQDYIDEFPSVGTAARDAILANYNIEGMRNLTIPLDNNLREDIKTLILLKQFLSKLNRDITLEFLKSDLIQQGYWNTVEATGQANRLSLSILLLENLNLDKLHLCLLVSRYERFAYQDYQLFLDMEDVHDPLIHAEYREIQQSGFNNIELTTEIINPILEGYERNNNTNLESECLKVLEYNNEIVVFILRESQRGGLRTLREYIVGWNADLIVLRYSNNFKMLKVRAVSTVKEEVYITLANNVVKSNNPTLPINYIKCSFSNTREQIINLLHNLLSNEIIGVELNELILENTPFEGRPTIIIQRNSEVISLAQSLNDNSQGYMLSSIIAISRVSKIKVSYAMNQGQRVQKHIFGLKIVESDERYYIFISGQGGGLMKKLNLIELLNEITGVRIIELKEEN